MADDVRQCKRPGWDSYPKKSNELPHFSFATDVKDHFKLDIQFIVMMGYIISKGDAKVAIILEASNVVNP
jgi:hypothetical protein